MTPSRKNPRRLRVGPCGARGLLQRASVRSSLPTPLRGPWRGGVRDQRVDRTALEPARTAHDAGRVGPIDGGLAWQLGGRRTASTRPQRSGEPARGRTGGVACDAIPAWRDSVAPVRRTLRSGLVNGSGHVCEQSWLAAVASIARVGSLSLRRGVCLRAPSGARTRVLRALVCRCLGETDAPPVRGVRRPGGNPLVEEDPMNSMLRSGVRECGSAAALAARHRSVVFAQSPHARSRARRRVSGASDAPARAPICD